MFFLCILAKNLIIPRMSGLLKFATFCNQFLSSLLPDLDFLQHPAAGPRKSAFNLQKKISIQFFVTYSRAHFFSKVTFYLYQLSNNVSSGLKKVIFSTLKTKKCINFLQLLGIILSVVVVVVVEWPHLLMLATPSSSSPPRTPRSPSPAAPRLRPGSCVSGPHRAARLGMCGNAQYFYSSVPTTVLYMYSVVGILDTK